MWIRPKIYRLIWQIAKRFYYTFIQNQEKLSTLFIVLFSLLILDKDVVLDFPILLEIFNQNFHVSITFMTLLLMINKKFDRNIFQTFNFARFKEKNDTGFLPRHFTIAQ